MPAIPHKYLLIGGIVALVIAILALTYCQGKSAGKSGEVVKQQKHEIETKKEEMGAAENAAIFRVEDARKLDQQERELRDAVKDAKSDDDARARRGCAILRQQGRDTKNIPACR